MDPSEAQIEHQKILREPNVAQLLVILMPKAPRIVTMAPDVVTRNPVANLSHVIKRRRIGLSRLPDKGTQLKLIGRLPIARLDKTCAARDRRSCQQSSRGFGSPVPWVPSSWIRTVIGPFVSQNPSWPGPVINTNAEYRKGLGSWPDSNAIACLDESTLFEYFHMHDPPTISQTGVHQHVLEKPLARCLDRPLIQ